MTSGLGIQISEMFFFDTKLFCRLHNYSNWMNFQIQKKKNSNDSLPADRSVNRFDGEDLMDRSNDSRNIVLFSLCECGRD